VKRVCLVTASEMTLRAFLVEHVRALGQVYEVTLVSSFTDLTFWHGLGAPVTFVRIPVSRRIAPLADVLALLRLVRLFRRKRFDLVHSITPKAGFLSALAGVLTRVPIRAHTFTGQVWATRRGMARRLLKAADHAMAALLTDVLVDSRSQRTFLEEAGVLRRGRGVVLGDGSISGVDAGRFRPDPEARAAIRLRYGIPRSAVVYLYVGRVTVDKGVLTLAEAFARVRAACPDVRLLVVGPDEEGLWQAMRETLGDAVSASVFAGDTNKPEQFMAAADVLCLPSRREGFGTTVIEAAACGLPSIATKIYGLTDAVEDGRGGVLVAVDDAAALSDAMRQLADDSDRRLDMAASARERAIRDFSSDRLTAELLGYYRQRLAEARQ
jgi:glycosyltransferase involved in cell wall biosynthesis